MQIGHLSQARQHAEHGRYKKARAAYAKALAAAPDDAGILVEAGVLDAQNGQLRTARRLLDKALQLSPGDVSIHLNLAEVASLAEDHGSAITHYQAVLDVAREDVDALYGLGNALRAEGDMEKALPLLDRAHELDPSDPEILNALAIVLEAEEQTGRAMQCYHRAITLSPDYVDAWCNYAQILFHERRFPEAAQAYEGADKRSPDGLQTNFLLNWAVALSFSGQYARCFEIIDKAVAAGDQPANAAFVSGSIHMQYGDFETALKHLNQAIALNGNIGEAYEKLARINQLDLASADRLREILDDDSVTDTNRVGAGFALYKVLDKAGEHEEAFAALSKANSVKAETTKFSASEYESRMTRSIDVFTPEFFDAHKDEGLETRAPIFVLGMPRSGTTLVEQILAAYDEVKPCGEQQDFQHLAASLQNYPDNLGVLPADWAHGQGERILSKMLADAPTAKYATNKSPGNYAYIGLIAWIFPQARIIYCRRDPRDIGLSSFEQNFHSGLSFTYDLEAFAFAYLQQERIMQHWMNVSPLDMHIVDYEKLVGDQETQARAMVEFCDLNWMPECLDTGAVKRPIETASVWQARQPISKTSVGKWKRYERQLQPMIKALGMQ